MEPRRLTPVNVLTGFLGSGKTTLLQRMLQAPEMGRTAVLINEFGEVGLDHLLVQRVEETVVLLKSGCICCTIRGDLNEALRGLLGRRDRAEVPNFDRVVVETTGLADPGPILNTLLSEPVLQHHFRLGNVITTVDAVNAEEHLTRNPEGMKQVAAADRLIVTKTDLASPEQAAGTRAGGYWFAPGTAPGGLPVLRRHMEQVSSFSLVLAEPLDWTAFGVWLSLLLHKHGSDVLRVKGILSVQGQSAPVFVNAVQHLVHPPMHLERWPTADHRSRLVFITRNLGHERILRSLEAFCGSPVAELSVA